MWRISVQSVRHYWALFAGTFVALALGVALIGVSASALAATWAVDATPDGSTPSVTLKDGTGAARTLSSGDLDMGGVQSVLAMAGVVSAFVTVFVIAGTCAFGIALRRRDMGLLRLVGAGGGQVRRMVLGESLAVAVPAAVAGCAVAAVTAPLAVEALNGTGLSPVDLRPGPLLWPLVFAAGSGLVIAVLGMLAASKRAARVRPTEALREADLDSRTMTAGRAVTGVLALLGGAVMVALAPGSGTEAATPLALFGTMALAVAATLLGPLYLPPLLRVMALPLRWADPVAGRLAAESVRTSRRRTASLVGPVLAILAIVGVFTTVLSTTGAATSADDRARTTAQLVVEPAGDGGSLDQEAVDRLREDPRVAAVSAPAPLEIAVAGPHSAWKEQAALADPVALSRTHRITVVDGSLKPLEPGTVAISREFAEWYGHRAGSTVTYGLFGGEPVRAKVAAVLDGGSAVPSVVLPPDTRGATPAPAPERAAVLLDERGAASAGAAAARLTERLGADRVRVLPTETWFGRSATDQDRLNNLVLAVLTVPASLYALIAVASTLVMSYSRRGREITGMRMIGVSAGQVRRMALWETLATTTLGTLIAAAVVAWGVRAYQGSLSVFGGGAPLSVPWGMLGTLVAACVLVGVVVSLAATGRLLRRVSTASTATRQ
ncbi:MULTISPECIES: FtsX-like permease family protein [Streptomyces]|uniref:ABC transporter permease n=1 Tax=Streptomyces wadayamensis TaxID=141454 RepID=A0ABR4SJT9_9ACTN|nr:MULTISPECIES: FtsX-like permease family protein [Streptomyces]KDR64594.1 ABC transporter permease [Streptomyces wadayamensis]QXQ27703.1 FtsX-like permease family protein [Streptomyces albidoflavus]QXQ33631.1 FtsX-like permease family protein [Streptomyces albidoflavus]RZD73337.1 ABC transporter permease [Streptomyces albidoflavus]